MNRARTYEMDRRSSDPLTDAPLRNSADQSSHRWNADQELKPAKQRPPRLEAKLASLTLRKPDSENHRLTLRGIPDQKTRYLNLESTPWDQAR